MLKLRKIKIRKINSQFSQNRIFVVTCSAVITEEREPFIQFGSNFEGLFLIKFSTVSYFNVLFIILGHHWSSKAKKTIVEKLPNFDRPQFRKY